MARKKKEETKTEEGTATEESQTQVVTLDPPTSTTTIPDETVVVEEVEKEDAQMIQPDEESVEIPAEVPQEGARFVQITDEECRELGDELVAHLFEVRRKSNNAPMRQKIGHWQTLLVDIFKSR